MAVAIETGDQDRAIAPHGAAFAQGAQDVLTPRPHARRRINHRGNPAQRVVLGISIYAARRLAEEVRHVHGGFVIQVAVGVRTRGEKGFEERGIGSITPRLRGRAGAAVAILP